MTDDVMTAEQTRLAVRSASRWVSDLGRVVDVCNNGTTMPWTRLAVDDLIYRADSITRSDSRTSNEAVIAVDGETYRVKLRSDND